MSFSKEILTAEAHLYVAVAKADGVISDNEFAQMPYYAAKSQRFFDMMKMNEETAKRIGREIRGLLASKEHEEWNSEKHVYEAKRLLDAAREDGFWQAQVAFQKNEVGLTESAKIGGYVFTEAKVIRLIEELLA